MVMGIDWENGEEVVTVDTVQEHNKKHDKRIEKKTIANSKPMPERDEEEVKPQRSQFIRVERFAEEVMRLLGKHKNVRDETFEKYLGVKKDKMWVLNTEFASYKRSQAIYALNKFAVTRCKLVRLANLTDDADVALVYENVRLKRNKYEALLTEGEMFLEYEGTKFILTLYFEGCVRRAYLRCRQEDFEVLDEFQTEFRDFMRTKNFLKGEKLVLMPRAQIDFLEYPNLGWDDVILDKKLKEEIILNIVFPLSKEKECIRSGIPWRRGLLMGGLAGTGKTQVCRILCNELPKGVTMIWSTPKALYDSEKIQLLFEAARYFSPTLIIIEDIDFIGTSREIARNEILGELLTQLDGNDPNHGIFVIATTNRPELLDVALANRPSRFDVKVEFSLPSENERIQLMKLFTKKMKFDKSLDYQMIAREMGNKLTGAQIKEVFVYAQLRVLMSGKGRKVRIEDVRERVSQYRKDSAQEKYTS